MFIKWLALGFYGRSPSGKWAGYFSEPWNWLDGIIVMAGFANYIPGIGSNASALRTFRVLRPLRTLSAIPSMRVVVSSMLTALPALGNVVLLAVFTLLVFGIIGIQLWAGLLRGRCAYQDPMSTTGDWVTQENVFCALPCSVQEGAECTPAGGDECQPALVSWQPMVFDNATSSTVQGNVTSVAFLDTQCIVSSNPYRGLVSFDDIGHASLTLFTGITLEGWSDTIYYTQHTWGYKPVVAIYWMVVVAFGAFFLLQLALAVIWESFQGSTTTEEDKCDALLSQHAHLLAAYLRKKRNAGPLRRRILSGIGMGARWLMGGCDGREQRQMQHEELASPRAEDVSGISIAPGSRLDAAGSIHTYPTAPSPTIGNSGGGAGSAELAWPPPVHKPDDPLAAAGPTGQYSYHPKGPLAEIVESLPKPKPKREYPPVWPALSAFTSHPYFGHSMTGVILLNTLQLAMPYADMSEAYSNGLSIANYCFSAVFGVEMVLKLIGDGPHRYLSDTVNCFDCAIVMISFVDIALTAVMGDSAGGQLRCERFDSRVCSSSQSMEGAEATAGDDDQVAGRGVFGSWRADDRDAHLYAAADAAFRRAVPDGS